MENERTKELVKANRTVHTAQQEPEGEVRPSTRPAVRTATKDQFEKAQRKTSAVHAGLFRRLAK